MHDPTVLNESTNTMDVWMLSYTQTLVQFVHNEMEVYRLYTVVRTNTHIDGKREEKERLRKK